MKSGISLGMKSWVPFVTPMPVWDYWPWLILPLIAAIAVVYKAVKTERVDRVPVEAAKLFGYILSFVIVAALALAALVEWR